MAEKKKLNKKTTNYLVYTVAAIMLVIVFVLLFGGGGKQEEVEEGVNTELPDPSERKQSLDDKKNQYEFDFDERRSFDDNLFSLFEQTVGEEEPAGDNLNPSSDSRGRGGDAANDEDPFAALQRGLEENKESLNALQENIDARREGRLPEDTPSETSANVDNNLVSIENEGLRKQLELQKEANENLTRIIQKQEDSRQERERRYEDEVEAQKRKKNTMEVRPITAHGEGVVSTLRGGTFQGLGGQEASTRNTIRASVYGRQTVTVGQQVRLRLMEPMQVGGMVLPVGSIVTGTIGIGIDRIYVNITHIVYQQTLMAVELEAFDMDGQRGLFVPDNMENEAIRDLFIELTQSLSSTMEQSTSSFINTEKALEQLKSDLARGAVQGLGNFIRKKLEKVKITVSDNHSVLLYAGE